MAKFVIDKTDKRFPVGKYAPEKGSKAKVKTLLEVLKDDVTYVDVMIRKGEVELRGQAKIAFESRIRGVKSRLTAAQVEKEEGTKIEEAVVEDEETSEEMETSPEDLGEDATEEASAEQHPGEEAVQEQPELEKTEDTAEPEKGAEDEEPTPSKKGKSNKKK